MYSNCRHIPSLSCTSDLTLRGTMRFPHPAAGRLHLDSLWWTAGAETSERGIYHKAFWRRSSRLPSLPQASRSYDRPPPCLDSLTPDAHKADPFHHLIIGMASMPAFPRQPFLTPTPIAKRQLDFDPPFIFAHRLALSLDDLSCGSCGH
jgi:hypothetical protein